MVGLKEIKKKLKEFKTLKEQKEYLDGLLEVVEDKFLIKAINKLIVEIDKLLKQEKKDLPHKTIDDIFRVIENDVVIEPISVPARSPREVLREVRDYYVGIRAEPEKDTLTEVVRYVTPAPSGMYTGSRDDTVKAIRGYLKDVKKMTTSFDKNTFESWSGTEQMSTLYDIVEKTAGISDPLEVRDLVWDVMNVRTQYDKEKEKEKEDEEKKYLKGPI
jgi:hypothetical protein